MLDPGSGLSIGDEMDLCQLPFGLDDEAPTRKVRVPVHDEQVAMVPVGFDEPRLDRQRRGPIQGRADHRSDPRARGDAQPDRYDEKTVGKSAVRLT